ncbi:MAG: hypothetical protein OXI27_09415 [Thaumarchaeota archaeon]|nr:hypothetical protein [Nitrososphaerota archaeon]
MRDQIITHADIRHFAETRVNLPSDRVSRYREQVNNMREELTRHIRDNPGFGLVKILTPEALPRGLP